MDRLNSHRAAVRRLMERHAALMRQAAGDKTEVVLVVDQEQQRFMLLDVGWSGRRRVNNIHLHVCLKDDKIWVEEDWTEDGIATELMRAGVPAADIVLGFQPPERRHLTAFAVA
jgi:XisI protein